MYLMEHLHFPSLNMNLSNPNLNPKYEVWTLFRFFSQYSHLISTNQDLDLEAISILYTTNRFRAI